MSTNPPKSAPRFPVSPPLPSPASIHQKRDQTHGAIITLAPGRGIEPTPSSEEGTAASQASSCWDSLGAEEVYQLPAWVAGRDVIVFIETGEMGKGLVG